MQNKALLTLGVILLAFGLFKPTFNLSTITTTNSITTESYVIDPPSADELLDKAKVIINILEQSDDSTKSTDCLKLSSLYSDMAKLIELDNEDTVIQDTSSIRQANMLAGKMLRLNIKDKYPNLAEAAKDLLVTAIGSDDIILDSNARSKAVDAFRTLSWAFYEGSK